MKYLVMALMDPENKQLSVTYKYYVYRNNTNGIYVLH